MYLRKNARHFLRNFATEAVGLDEIHGGEEARLAEKVGPSVRSLHFELVYAVAQSEFLESGGAFGEEKQVEGVIRPIGKRDFDGNPAELRKSGQRGAGRNGGGVFLH